jgi:hypothetical protein
MAEERPWREGRSILAVIREADRPGEAELPDEPPADPTQIRWSPGSLDGVMARHFGGGEPVGGIAGRVRRLIGRRRDPAAEIASRVERLVRNPGDEERLALYRSAQDEDVLAHVDAVLERLVADPELLAAAEPHARWLAREARHRGPLKLGIAMLGVCGGAEDVVTLQTLAAHDEFTLYCAVALSNLLPDPVAALWDVARSADGWGKVETVERLAPQVGDRPEIKRWLLTDGCRNSVMNEYLAYTCATHGGLADALRGEVDDALLDGACTIVSALCEGGPAEDLDDYEDGPEVVRRLLDLLRDRCTTLDRLDTVIDVKLRLEDDAEVVAGCDSILAADHWPGLVRAAFERDDGDRWTAWRAAPHVGVDLWEAGFEQLAQGPLDGGLVFQLVHVRDAERRRRVVEWAERELPVETLATGPGLHLFAAEHHELDGAVTFVVQEMRDGELYSERLVAAALLSPVIGTRNQGLNALEAQPRERWGEQAEQALARLLREEPHDDVRERVAALAARTS